MTDAPNISPELVNKRVTDLRGQVAKMRRELETLQEELNWWEEGRKFFGGGAEGANGSSPGQTALISDEKPVLREAIRQVMNERANSTWPAERVILELDRRGWSPSGKNAAHTIRSMLANMKNRGELKRTGRGRYRLPPVEDEA